MEEDLPMGFAFGGRETGRIGHCPVRGVLWRRTDVSSSLAGIESYEALQSTVEHFTRRCHLSRHPPAA